MNHIIGTHLENQNLIHVTDPRSLETIRLFESTLQHVQVEKSNGGRGLLLAFRPISMIAGASECFLTVSTTPCLGTRKFNLRVLNTYSFADGVVKRIVYKITYYT